MDTPLPKHKKLETCYYCDTVFSTSKSASGDHFPIPRRNRGIDVVPCCKTCHEAKDSIGLDSWTPNMFNDVCKDFPKLNKNTRLFLAKVLSIATDYMNPLTDPELEEMADPFFSDTDDEGGFSFDVVGYARAVLHRHHFGISVAPKPLKENK